MNNLKKPNKFQNACGSDAFSTRPFERRYMHYFYVFISSMFLSFQVFGQNYADEASEKIVYWSPIVRNALSSHSFDSEVFEWGKKNNFDFKYVEQKEFVIYDYLLEAEVGTYKSSGIDCDYQKVFIRVGLNEFKQVSGTSVSKGMNCE